MEDQNKPPAPDIVPGEPAAPHDLAQADAKAFMVANELKPSGKPLSGPTAGTKSPFLYLILFASVALIITLLYAHSQPKPTSAAASPTPTPSELTVPNTPNPADQSGLSSQAQQDIKACSNVANAALSC